MKLQFELLNQSIRKEKDNKGSFHEKTLKDLILKNLPKDLFSEDNLDALKKAKYFFSENIPIVKWSRKKDNNLSIILICNHRKNTINFFYDMISRWLIARKALNIEYFFSSDFSFLELSDKKFTIMEAIVNLENESDFEIIEKNKRSFETELRLGVISDFHANRISQFKGLSSDRKTAMVQETIGSLMEKRPKEFGKNIFSEMQQFLIMSRDEFKSQRDYHHISRIISILYMIRKLLNQNLVEETFKRHVVLKFLTTKLKTKNLEEKIVLGVFVGLNFLNELEVFEKKHLIDAIKHFFDDVSIIENSFFMDKSAKKELVTCYIEIEKQNGLDFSIRDKHILKNELPIYLKDNVEQLIHPVFMPRNEEEIVKNMLVLSQQLKYVHDIPQVIISFDKHSHAELSFNVILLRVLKINDLSLKDLIEKSKSKLKIAIDKVKKIGVVRRKYLKEANVFSVILDSSKYLRTDHNVDINKARSDVLNELNRLFGEIRDYNGGMILKQNEVYKSLKVSLDSLVLGSQYDPLLDKFFYSLNPVEMTAVINPEILKNVFLMLINTIKREQTRIKKVSDFLFKQEAKQMHAIIPIYNEDIKNKISQAVDQIDDFATDLVHFYLTFNEISYLGYILLSPEKSKQKILFDIIQKNT